MKYGRETYEATLPTNQKFGWFFVIIFILSTIFAFLENSNILATLFATIAFIFFVLTTFTPNLLSVLNRLWFEFGLLLGKIVSPVVLGFIFFVLITPVAVVTRFFGRDVLFLKKRNIQSYWIERDPKCPVAESFKNQF